jgi:hypothetical protein
MIFIWALKVTHLDTGLQDMHAFFNAESPLSTKLTHFWRAPSFWFTIGSRSDWIAGFASMKVSEDTVKTAAWRQAVTAYSTVIEAKLTIHPNAIYQGFFTSLATTVKNPTE